MHKNLMIAQKHGDFQKGHNEEKHLFRTIQLVPAQLSP
jgi:hypothetical protein